MLVFDILTGFYSIFLAQSASDNLRAISDRCTSKQNDYTSSCFLVVYVTLSESQGHLLWYQTVWSSRVSRNTVSNDCFVFVQYKLI